MVGIMIDVAGCVIVMIVGIIIASVCASLDYYNPLYYYFDSTSYYVAHTFFWIGITLFIIGLINLFRVTFNRRTEFRGWVLARNVQPPPRTTVVTVIPQTAGNVQQNQFYPPQYPVQQPYPTQQVHIKQTFTQPPIVPPPYDDEFTIESKKNYSQ